MVSIEEAEKIAREFIAKRRRVKVDEVEIKSALHFTSAWSVITVTPKDRDLIMIKDDGTVEGFTPI